jgi:hypothetical protein
VERFASGELELRKCGGYTGRQLYLSALSNMVSTALSGSGSYSAVTVLYGC